MNSYMYCKNNPLSMVDPSGNTPLYLHLLDIYGGLWANRLPKPDYPGNWTSWINFFGWYAHGEGETVDLRKVGLIGAFRENEEIAA
jgi:hypothetical protein